MYLSWCSIFEMSTFLQYLYLSGPREHGRFSGGEAEGRGSMERITSWLFPSGGRRYRLESRRLTLSEAPRDWLGWSLLVLMSSHESSSTSTATRAETSTNFDRALKDKGPSASAPLRRYSEDHCPRRRSHRGTRLPPRRPDGKCAAR